MDLVDWKEDAFHKVESDFRKFASRLDVADIRFIPISALLGDNVVDRSKNMPWYGGSPLLETLETVYIGDANNHVDARFPVQWVIRPQSAEHHDFRGYAGRVASGVFKPGDEETVLPSGFTSRIKAIHTMDGEQEEAFAPQSVSMLLYDEIDISRGDMIVKPNNKPRQGQDIEAMICWFSDSETLRPGSRFLLKHTSKEVKAIVRESRYKVNVNTLHKVEGDHEFKLNEIGRISLRVSAPLFHDSYKNNRTTGSFILVDPNTNVTVAAGMII
jgi:sulfate adenylyltransferase subunit 1